MAGTQTRQIWAQRGKRMTENEPDKKLAYSFPPLGEVSPDEVQGEYKAFTRIREEGRAAINIDIQMKGERFFLMNCHLIRGVEFRGNTAFEIFYDQDRFVFEGSNLLQIKPFLQQQKLVELQEFDSSKHSGTLPREEAVITSIHWVRIDEQIEDVLE